MKRRRCVSFVLVDRGRLLRRLPGRSPPCGYPRTAGALDPGTARLRERRRSTNGALASVGVDISMLQSGGRFGPRVVFPPHGYLNPRSRPPEVRRRSSAEADWRPAVPDLPIAQRRTRCCRKTTYSRSPLSLKRVDASRPCGELPYSSSEPWYRRSFSRRVARWIPSSRAVAARLPPQTSIASSRSTGSVSAR